MELLNEKEVRNLLTNELIDMYRDCLETRTIIELGLDFGAARMNVAVLNGILHRYEIKSDLDTLYRMSRQTEYYNCAFHHL